MTEEAAQKSPKGQAQLERFVRAFEASTEAVAALHELIGHKDDGLIAAIDDLRDELVKITSEIHELRKDIRATAKARGLGAVFDILR